MTNIEKLISEYGDIDAALNEAKQQGIKEGLMMAIQEVKGLRRPEYKGMHPEKRANTKGVSSGFRLACRAIKQKAEEV